MATLPALANLFAVRDEDPQALAALTERLVSCGEFERVFHPAPHWVCAKKYLPDSEPDPELALQHGFVFLEGREKIERSLTANGGYPGLVERVTRSPEALDQLPGDFTFLHFQDNGDALVARCIAGFVPVYLWHTARRTVLATRLEYLVNLAGTPREADQLVYAIFACGGVLLPDWRSPIKGVSVIPNGAVQHIRSGRASAPISYFKPKLPERRLPTNEEIDARAAAIRNATFEYLQCHLHPTGYNLCSFSGGVDSSSVVALAAGRFKVPTATWGMIPGWEPDRSRELSYIEPLLAEFKVQKSWKVFLEDNTILELLQNSPHSIFPVTQQVLLALSHLVKELDIRTVLGGEFADEAFGSVKTTPDLSQSLTAGQALRLTLTSDFRTGPRWLKHHLQWLRDKPLVPYMEELQPLIHPGIRNEYLQWLSDTRRQITSSDSRNYYLLRSCEIFWAFTVMYWEACSPIGIRRLMPFFNRKVLELASAAHPRERLFDGIKTLMRRALREDVPARNLYRPDKGYWSRIPLPAAARVRVTGPFPALLDPRSPMVEFSGIEQIVANCIQRWSNALQRHL